MVRNNDSSLLISNERKLERTAIHPAGTSVVVIVAKSKIIELL
jgi:hypothetical protein